MKKKRKPRRLKLRNIDLAIDTDGWWLFSSSHCDDSWGGSEREARRIAKWFNAWADWKEQQ